MNRSMLRLLAHLRVVVLVGGAGGASGGVGGKNDIAIVIGAVVLFLAILFARRQQKR